MTENRKESLVPVVLTTPPELQQAEPSVREYKLKQRLCEQIIIPSRASKL